MKVGPIEVLVVGFPGNQFNGEILPELERLVSADTIHIVDGLLVRKDADGSVTFLELDDVTSDESVARLSALVDQLEALISDEDVDELVRDARARLVRRDSGLRTHLGDSVPRRHRRVRRRARRQLPGAGHRRRRSARRPGRRLTTGANDMMRRRFGRPGLVGTMARTAVVAGTASAVVGGVNRRQSGRRTGRSRRPSRPAGGIRIPDPDRRDAAGTGSARSQPGRAATPAGSCSPGCRCPGRRSDGPALEARRHESRRPARRRRVRCSEGKTARIVTSAYPRRAPLPDIWWRQTLTTRRIIAAGICRRVGRPHRRCRAGRRGRRADPDRVRAVRRGPAAEHGDPLGAPRRVRVRSASGTLATGNGFFGGLQFTETSWVGVGGNRVGIQRASRRADHAGHLLVRRAGLECVAGVHPAARVHQAAGHLRRALKPARRGAAGPQHIERPHSQRRSRAG